MSRLSGKRTLITGGTSGIGLATAKSFLAEGARVIITGVNPDRPGQRPGRARLGRHRARCRFRQCRSAARAGRSRRRRVRPTRRRLHQCRRVGLAAYRGVDRRGLRPILRDQRQGPYFLIQALLPVFANPASVVLNTSINAHVGMTNSSVYAATKAAFLSFSKTLSNELIGWGVRFNAVSPGPVETPLYDKLGIPEAYRDQATRAIAASIPLGRFGTPEEVAKAVLYLASDESAWTLGAEIIVDGGRTLNG